MLLYMKLFSEFHSWIAYCKFIEIQLIFFNIYLVCCNLVELIFYTSNCFIMNPLGFSIYMIMLVANTDSFTTSFIIWVPFIIFFFSFCPSESFQCSVEDK